MTCGVTAGRPRNVTRVTWKKGKKTLTTSGRYKLSNNGTVLRISSPNHTLDDAEYSCAATNRIGTGSFSTKFKLRLNCKCSSIYSEMSVNVTLTNLVLDVMPTVCFFCSRANETQHKYYNKDGPLSVKENYLVILVRTVIMNENLYYRVYKKYSIRSYIANTCSVIVSYRF